VATRLGFSPYMRDVSEGEPGRSKRLETNDVAARLRLAIELELDLVLRRPSVLDGEPLWDSALPPFCHLSCVEIITVIVSLNFNPLHS
jgi:hypothetical protein